MLDNIELVPILDSVERLQMEDPEYFALDAVSNSRLSLINPDQGGSPQKFFIEKKFTESSALELGSGVHQLLLEKDKYFLSEFEKPGGKVGTIIKLAYTLANRESNPLSYDEALQISCKTHDYYSTCLTDNRLAALKEKGAPYYEFLGKETKPGMIVLTTDQKDKCIKCVGSVKANQVAYNLLYPQTSETLLSFHEDVLVMDIKGVIKDPDLELDTDCLIKIKSKLDHWSIDLEKNIITLNDLKTTGKPIQFFPGRKTETKDIFGNNAFIDGSFQTYHYHRQMAKNTWPLIQ